MPQSLSAAYMHIVFSTKNRLPLIIPELRSTLWMYLGGVCRGLHCMPVQIGGTSDHVHILSLLARDIAIQALIAKVKAESSRSDSRFSMADRIRYFFGESEGSPGCNRIYCESGGTPQNQNLSGGVSSVSQKK